MQSDQKKKVDGAEPDMHICPKLTHWSLFGQEADEFAQELDDRNAAYFNGKTGPSIVTVL